MAYFSTKRKVAAVTAEGTPGTLATPNPATDAIPMLRESKPKITPMSVARKTVRLTHTPYGDLYPGKSTATVTVEFELTANPNFSGAGTSGGRPLYLARLLNACGMVFHDETQLLRTFKLGAITTNKGPFRHGERVSGAGVILADDWRVFGDAYADDGILTIKETAANTFSGSGTFTGETSGTAIAVSNRNANAIYGFGLTSNVVDPSSGSIFQQRTCSFAHYADGKLLLMKGCMGDAQFLFKHGDAVVVSVELQGVVVSYTDSALPTNALESHKVPPTFLGSRIALRRPVNTAGFAERYGTGGLAGFTGYKGSLTEMQLRLGNKVTLPKNAMDANGVNFAIINGRAPVGSFDPEEVNNTQFDFRSWFVGGKPLRLRVTVLGPPNHSSYAFDDPATANNNTWDWITPGITFSGQEDAERDGFYVLDSSFDLGGGDYDETDLGEAPGIDNEITMLCR